MVLEGFERRIDRLVTGVFARAFRSGIQPVEVGKRMQRELESSAQMTPRGTIAPNVYEIALSVDDDARFETFRAAMVEELAQAIRDHVRDHDYRLLGPVDVSILTDSVRKQGDFDVVARIVPATKPQPSAIRLNDGRRIQLVEPITKIGRMSDCAIQLTDSQSSRYHAEIHARPDGVRLVDLDSTNGTFVNGVVVSERELRDGDRIVIGSCTLVFEES